MNASLTASNEGLRLQAYDDETGADITHGDTIKGTVTIAWGLAVSKPFGGIERDEADCLLLYRLWGIRRALRLRFANWDQLSETRRAVLSDVAYNRGLSLFDMMGGLKTAIEGEDWILAAHIIASCPAAKNDPKRYARLQSIMATDTPTFVAAGSEPYLSPDFKQFVEECSS